MLRTIEFKDLDTDLIPQAIISRPVSYFEKKLGIHFLEAHDDLDAYQGAALSLNGNVRFALKHYQGHPDNTATIYLSRELKDLKEITSVIMRIVDELKLTPDAICWQRSDHPNL